MTDTNTMADNAVRCNGNGASDGNRMSNSNRVGDGMADNTMSNSDGNIRVGGSAVIGDLGNKALRVIGVVADVLDPAVGKVDGVGAVPEAGSIVSLSLLEGSARELISHTVLVGVGGDLGQVIVADSVGHRMSHSVHDRSSNGVHHRASHSYRSSNSHAMANQAVSSHKTVSSHETMSSHETVSTHKTTSSQQLGGSRGSSSQGRDTKEGLWGKEGQSIW